VENDMHRVNLKFYRSREEECSQVTCQAWIYDGRPILEFLIAVIEIITIRAVDVATLNSFQNDLQLLNLCPAWVPFGCEPTPSAWFKNDGAWRVQHWEFSFLIS
jgi:hypothetical protein